MSTSEDSIGIVNRNPDLVATTTAADSVEIVVTVLPDFQRPCAGCEALRLECEALRLKIRNRDIMALIRQTSINIEYYLKHKIISVFLLENMQLLFKNRYGWIESAIRDVKLFHLIGDLKDLNKFEDFVNSQFDSSCGTSAQKFADLMNCLTEMKKEYSLLVHPTVTPEEVPATFEYCRNLIEEIDSFNADSKKLVLEALSKLHNDRLEAGDLNFLKSY